MDDDKSYNFTFLGTRIDDQMLKKGKAWALRKIIVQVITASNYC